MESVEVWMWVIAGLLIGSIMFVAGSSLLARYLNSQDIGIARSNFNQIAEISKKICRLGIYSEETMTLRIPSVASKIAVVDKDLIEGQGNDICLWIRNQAGSQCEKIDTCETKMNSVVFEADQTPFYMIQRLTGAKQPAVITFKITKTGFDAVQITWKPN
ncbi:MAG: hypothetical protein AABX51_08270 [Nanoarchaeota archaeon]|mgnify:CR=1 FL=1